MPECGMDRRRFLTVLGAGSAAAGTGAVGLGRVSTALGGILATPRVLGATKRGVLVESEAEYGGFVVEKLTDGRFPYEIDEGALTRMSEKFTMFSRNVWAPERQNRPERSENTTRRNLVEEGGTLPNQTRLDYALMAAAWRHANTSGSRDYDWNGVGGQVRGAGLDRMGLWDPADLDMTWEDATLAVRHAALFFGASLAGVAELNPLWIYSDHFSPTREDRERTIPIHYGGDRFEQTEDAWYIPESMNRVISLAFEEVSGRSGGKWFGAFHPYCHRRRVGPARSDGSSRYSQVRAPGPVGQGHHRYAPGARLSHRLRRHGVLRGLYALRR